MSYCMFAIVNKQKTSIWKTLINTWTKIYGMCECVVTFLSYDLKIKWSLQIDVNFVALETIFSHLSLLAVAVREFWVGKIYKKTVVFLTWITDATFTDVRNQFYATIIGQFWTLAQLVSREFVQENFHFKYAGKMY